jgi:hypothetical protein
VQWLTENRAPSAREEVERRVAQETVHILRAPIQAIAWYPFRALVEIDRAIAALSLAREPASVIRDLGRYSARQHVPSAGAEPAGGPHEFFSSSARVHSHFIDFGRAEYAATGARSGRLTLLDYRCYSPVLCWSGQGYYEQAAALRGGRSPQVRESSCVCEGAASCCFEITWS